MNGHSAAPCPEHQNLICEPEGIPCDSSDLHQAESPVQEKTVAAVMPFARPMLPLSTQADDPRCAVADQSHGLACAMHNNVHHARDRILAVVKAA
jgi:hypothetical protein